MNTQVRPRLVLMHMLNLPLLVGRGALESSVPANNNLINLTGNHIGTLNYGQVLVSILLELR